MGLLNRYLFKKAFVTICGLVALAICILLLERLLRIFQIVTNSINPAGDAAAMIFNLLPYYVAMALPMAFLLGIIMTIDRFSRSSELTSSYGAGISLAQITKPFFGLAFIMVGLSLFVEGYMQPVGRYNYRSVVHSVKQNSYAAALREGTFTTIGNKTFFAGTERPGKAIGPIFIYEEITNKAGQKGIRLTTAGEGRLIVHEVTNDPVLQLAEGQTQQIFGSELLEGELGFEASAVASTAAVSHFRPRGDDEREMTTLELFKNRKGEVYPDIDVKANNATLNLRIAQAALLLILPFLGVPLGVNYGRNPSSAGLFFGIVLMLAIQKALEFGQKMGAEGVIPPWAGIWPTVFIIALVSFYIFWKTAFKMGAPPMTSLIQFFMRMGKAATQSLRETGRDLAKT